MKKNRERDGSTAILAAVLVAVSMERGGELIKNEEEEEEGGRGRATAAASGGGRERKYVFIIYFLS